MTLDEHIDNICRDLINCRFSNTTGRPVNSNWEVWGDAGAGPRSLANFRDDNDEYGIIIDPFSLSAFPMIRFTSLQIGEIRAKLSKEQRRRLNDAAQAFLERWDHYRQVRSRHEVEHALNVRFAQ